MTCRINHHEIRTERDIEKIIAELNEQSLAEWGRPLSEGAKVTMYRLLRPCVQAHQKIRQLTKKGRAILREKSKRESFSPTFQEMISGKSADQIKKDRKEALESEQKKREAEARAYREREV